METIAVYWEARVKVYGITGRHGLAMGVLRFPAGRLGCWGERLVELEDALPRFELVTCRGVDDGMMELTLVIEAAGRDVLLGLVNGWLEREKSAQFAMEGTVDMVFLHGPHFQDRFGIAETAFAALGKNQIEILLAGCAGTSMYLILTEGEGMPAMKILEDTYLIPTAT